LSKFVLAAFVGLSILALPVAALAEDLKFDLVNNSARAIKNFYTSPTNADTWQEDVLGEDVIPAGGTEAVTIADGSDQCTYDMRFIMEDGAELVDKNIDLCKLGTYTVSDAK